MATSRPIRDVGSVDDPRVSVVVRSMKRLGPLAELLRRLLAQEHDSFEVVIVEQTIDPDPAELAAIQPLFDDPRVRVISTEPLGGPGARNRGVREARGAVVILIDDDDLPLGFDWIASHEAIYADPAIIGATARHVSSPGERDPYPAILGPLWRSRCMSYSLLKTPYVYARLDRDKQRVGWLHGTNASFRRDRVIAAGLWDTGVRAHDEHSLAFKLQRTLEPGERLVFRAYPPVLRRWDVGGGLEKRKTGALDIIGRNYRYARQVIGTYFPRRFRWLRPLYLLWAALMGLDWALAAWRVKGASFRGRLGQWFGALPRTRRLAAEIDRTLEAE